MEKVKYLFIEEVSSCIKLYFQNIAPDVADLIGCQFALESAYGHSSLAHNNNNYCGMKTPLVRISTAENAGCASPLDQFAKYNSLHMCIVDYILWLQYQRPGTPDLTKINVYVSILRKYCPEKDYISKIQSIYQQFKNYKNE